MDRQDFMRRFFFKKRSKLNPATFDAFAAEDINKATTRAKQLLGVDDYFVNEYSPVIVSMPAVTTKTVEPILVYGVDKLRYDLTNFRTLFFGKDFLFHYSCMIDHKTGASFNDTAVEIPYSKITSLTTASRFDYIDKVEHHIFEIKIGVSNSEEIVIPIRVILVDSKTPKEDYLLEKELLELSASLKAFLRTKINK